MTFVAAGGPLLEGVKVLDLSTGVTGSFCARLLGGLGADVWRATADEADETSPMAVHLNGRKHRFSPARSEDVDCALVGASIVLVDEGANAHRSAIVERCRGRIPVVSITPWGPDGPWVDRPASELVLQASCGAIHPRGAPGAEPLAAGGDLGMWSTGLFALVASLAALRSAEHGAGAPEVDLSLLESMSIVLNGYAPLKRQLGGSGWPLVRGTELPSIVEAKDGYLVVTTNTRQQFDDFLVLIDRPDLLGDDDLASAKGREARREEFDAAVAEWMRRHTLQEVLDLTEVLRIPAAIVADGKDILALDHFRERGVFVPSVDGAFLEPRPPFLVHGGRDPVHAVDESGEPVARPAPDLTAGDLPLRGIRVVDITAWWSGPSATQVLGSLGADVIKVESAQRFDGVRTSQTAWLPPTDQWWETSCLYHFANVNKRSLTLDLRNPAGLAVLRRLISSADLVIENYSTRVFDQFGLSWEVIQDLNPKASLVRMPAFGLSGPWKERTAFSQTMECISGLATVTGTADGAPLLVRGACDPVAGLSAAAAFLAALQRRDRTGRGSFVEVPMAEAALCVAAAQTVSASAGLETPMRMGNRALGVAPQGVYRCAGDDQWVALTVADDIQWAALCAMADLDAAALGSPAGLAERSAVHDEIDRAIASWTAKLTAADVVRRLAVEGVAAAEVTPAADVIYNPQLRHRGFVERYDHPLTGPCETFGLPFSVRGRTRHWVRTAPPTLGQHNQDILISLLGLSSDEVASLRHSGVVAEGPSP